MTYEYEKQGKCRWCGAEGRTEEHHLYRRSTNPSIKDMKEIKVDLCPRCHRRATTDRKFEEKLQRAFCPVKPVGKAANEL